MTNPWRGGSSWQKAENSSEAKGLHSGAVSPSRERGETFSEVTSQVQPGSCL